MDDASDQFRLGLELFNRGDFYECHDTLEDLWLQESSGRQPFLQGLIQAAVAFHHYRHGKLGAARSMLGLSLAKLSKYPPVTENLDLGSLRSSLQEWLRFLNLAVGAVDVAALTAPPLPQITPPGSSPSSHPGKVGRDDVVTLLLHPSLGLLGLWAASVVLA